VSYVPLGSPAALHAWGADDGVLHAKEFGFPIHFLGTDIAPAGPVGEEGTMLANMRSALGSDLAVVPVTQTSIAIAANPPRLPAHPACMVPRINAIQLQKVFSGEIKNWHHLPVQALPEPGQSPRLLPVPAKPSAPGRSCRRRSAAAKPRRTRNGPAAASARKAKGR
jgi:hypothetical protein